MTALWASASTLPLKLRKPFTVCIEGNIGCGKSTLLEYFSNNALVDTIQEPVGEWCDIGGRNALELLYKDPHRWSFSVNQNVILSRIKMHQVPSCRPIKMLERSIYSTRYVFVKNSFEQKFESPVEHAVQEHWLDHIMEHEYCYADLFVYLRTSPQTCYDRILKRGRPEEQHISQRFLQQLHDLHEDWLIKRKHGDLGGKMLVLDASHDLLQMKKTYAQWQDELFSVVFGWAGIKC